MTEFEGPSRTVRQQRGILERPKGSGVWWIRFHDQHGQERREKVGPKGLAKDRYQDRRAEVRAGKYVPPLERRRSRGVGKTQAKGWDPLFSDYLDDYLSRHRS